MNRKSDKVEEPTVPYVAKKVTPPSAGSKSVGSAANQADDVAFEKVAAKIFSERKKLLHKLAQ